MSQGDEANLVLPLGGFTADRNDYQFLERHSDRKFLSHDDQPRHPLGGGNPCPGVGNHGPSVVGENNARFGRCPGENVRVLGAREACIVHP
jgi:hypothetical protein